MNIEQLKHAIRAACGVAEDNEMIVFGSQAILGMFPEAHPRLRRSIEVDIVPKNKPHNVDKIDGALGEMSAFHKTHGFYVHGVSIDSAKLPPDWNERMVPVHDYMDSSKTGYCIEIHDLAVSKMIAFRKKDREFVRILIMENMVDVNLLIERLEKINADEIFVTRAVKWLKITQAEF